MLVVLSGPGGVGKGVIAAHLVDRDERLWLSRSWTTRARRPGEAADAYHFVDRKTFEAHIESSGFLEWAEFHGHLYGTPALRAPRGRDVLLEIDVQGARQVLQRHPEALLVFVDAPSRAHQAERLRGRGDPEEAVARRVAVAEREAELARELEAVHVVNDDLGTTVDEILSIIDQHRESAGRC